MQHDLDQLLSRRRRRRRIVGTVAVLFMLALMLGLARACSSQFNDPYNKAYTPLDTSRQPGKEPH
ncbi:MAG TPA: hypothetical protein VNI58_07735 [Mariprofundaceae bacterium]|nr:hypothetical protein [Mariprofundaceae bacterium]